MVEDQSQGSKRPATERADELLNRVGWTAGLFASMIGMRLSRVAAYAREEAEDFWAEAQSIRRRNDGDLGAAAGDAAEEARVEAEQAKEDSELSATSGGEAATATAAAEASSGSEAGTGTVVTEAPSEEEQKPEQSAESGREPMAGDYVGAAGSGEGEAAVSTERDTAPTGKGKRRAEAGP